VKIKIKMKVKAGLKIYDAEFNVFDSNGSLCCVGLLIDGRIQPEETLEKYFDTNKSDLVDKWNESVLMNTEKNNIRLIEL